MKKLAIASLAVGAILSSLAIAPAAQAAPLNSGFTCSFSSTTDVSAEAGVQTGVIGGGPLLIVEADASATHEGHLTCSIHVGTANKFHAGADAAVVVGPTTPGVVAVPESTVSYSAGVTDDVYLCTELTVDGTVYYYDETATNADPTASGDWSASASTAECGLAISASTPGEDEFPFDTINPILEPIELLIDSIICPVLSLVLPGGDIPLVWDCPPYGA